MLTEIKSVPIRTTQRVAEISWFSDLCGGDTQYLGVLDGERRSSFQHCADIVLNAERLGFNNVLLPSAYTVGQDVLSFACGVAPQILWTGISKVSPVAAAPSWATPTKSKPN